MVVVSFCLFDQMSDRLDLLAGLTGHSKSFHMIEAIGEHIDDLEDIYLTERELEKIRTGNSTTSPLSEVMKRHGMEVELSSMTEEPEPVRPTRCTSHPVVLVRADCQIR